MAVTFRDITEKIIKDKELIKYSGSQFDPELVKVFTNEVIKKLDFI